ncbi:hypothetical protein RI367_000420 [Sorochytrium milnesiophthora]
MSAGTRNYRPSTAKAPASKKLVASKKRPGSSSTTATTTALVHDADPAQIGGTSPKWPVIEMSFLVQGLLALRFTSMQAFKDPPASFASNQDAAELTQWLARYTAKHTVAHVPAYKQRPPELIYAKLHHLAVETIKALNDHLKLSTLTQSAASAPAATATEAPVPDDDEVQVLPLALEAAPEHSFESLDVLEAIVRMTGARVPRSVAAEQRQTLIQQDTNAWRNLSTNTKRLTATGQNFALKSVLIQNYIAEEGVENASPPAAERVDYPKRYQGVRKLSDVMASGDGNGSREFQDYFAHRQEQQQQQQEQQSASSSKTLPANSSKTRKPPSKASSSIASDRDFSADQLQNEVSSALNAVDFSIDEDTDKKPVLLVQVEQHRPQKLLEELERKCNIAVAKPRPHTAPVRKSTERSMSANKFHLNSNKYGAWYLSPGSWAKSQTRRQEEELMEHERFRNRGRSVVVRAKIDEIGRLTAQATRDQTQLINAYQSMDAPSAKPLAGKDKEGRAGSAKGDRKGSSANLVSKTDKIYDREQSGSLSNDGLHMDMSAVNASQSDTHPTTAQQADHVLISLADDEQPKSEGVAAATFHYVWLRDNCQCPHCLHPSTRQKLHSSGRVPLDVKPKHLAWIKRPAASSSSSSSSPASAAEDEWTLAVEWATPSCPNDTHRSEYPLSFLNRWNYSTRRLVDKIPHIKPTLWHDAKTITSTSGLRVSYEEFMSDDRAFWRVLDQMAKYGLCFLQGVPTSKHTTVEDVARRFGDIRQTFYGTSWDVKSVVNSENIAYTNLFLGLHMDLMYFEAPPGLQFLHMLRKSVSGGESLFLDMFAALESFAARHPQHHQVLSDVPVTYHYDHYPKHHYHFRHPLVARSDSNEHMRAFYAPPFQGPLEAEPEHVVPWYAAFRAWEEHLASCETFKIALEEGDCAVFHNRRVLHGREAFSLGTGATNERWLKGTYVDWDDFKDRWRVMRRRFGP